MFLPDTAYQTDNNQTAVTIQAWVYEKERRPGMTSALAAYLGINKNELAEAQRKRLYAQTALFKTDSERRKHLRVRFDDGSVHNLPATNSGGRSTAVAVITLPPDTAANTKIGFKLYPSDRATQSNEGYAVFVAETGLSVVSDIDDTIKDSGVADQKQLLVNTFINEFKAVEGMSRRYRQLARSYPNVSFHYVSSGPIQLYPALQAFMDAAGFPPGSFHLRESTTLQHVIAGEGDSARHKRSQIEKLLTRFPHRQFVLIGDSGEADPEIYAQMMKRYPLQIRFVAIRDVTRENRQAPRYRQTFSGLPAEKWTVFSETLPTLPF